MPIEYGLFVFIPIEYCPITFKFNDENVFMMSY